MGADVDAPLKFKFHWLNEKGQQTSVFAKKGEFDGELLTLEKTTLPAAVIVQSVVRDNRMVLAVMTGDEAEPVVTLVIQPSTKKIADELKSELDLARSRVWAEHHRRMLESKGLGHTYRDEECPNCTATLILTDMEPSPQVYCHFCDSLCTCDADSGVRKVERTLRLCEECGMYSSPRKFTIFYFYFLLVIYGFWSKPTWRCPACMRGDAWKMFFGNLPFVIGVPVAVTQLFRSYGGGVLGGDFKGLDTANIRARKGDISGALPLYRSILERVPHSAGVKYNLGLALLTQGDRRRAAETFELALEDCSNYAPAYNQLQNLYKSLGESEKLRELQRVWSTAAEESDSEDAME